MARSYISGNELNGRFRLFVPGIYRESEFSNIFCGTSHGALHLVIHLAVERAVQRSPYLHMHMSKHLFVINLRVKDSPFYIFHFRHLREPDDK